MYVSACVRYRSRRSVISSCLQDIYGQRWLVLRLVLAASYFHSVLLINDAERLEEFIEVDLTVFVLVHCTRHVLDVVLGQHRPRVLAQYRARFAELLLRDVTYSGNGTFEDRVPTPLPMPRFDRTIII